VAADNLRVTRHIVAQPALSVPARIQTRCAIPDQAKSWRAWLVTLPAPFFTGGHHAHGSVGRPLAVVDSHLRVRGGDCVWWMGVTQASPATPTAPLVIAEDRALDRRPLKNAWSALNGFRQRWSAGERCLPTLESAKPLGRWSGFRSNPEHPLPKS
jgi:hypothetical protein